VRGVPVAIFGLLWFVVAALLSLAGLRARDGVRESVPGYLFVLSTLALAVVLYLGYTSLFVLKAICLMCLTTYAAVVGLFLVSGAATSFPMTTLPRRASRDLRVLVASPLALTIVVVFFVGAVSTLAFFPREGVAGAGGPVPVPTQDQRSEFERWYVSQPRVPLIVASDGAKVLIVKFNDFQCPACGQSYALYKPILAKYEADRPGAVKMVLKDYPLNRECNENLTQTIHPAACDAAVAVRLALVHNRVDEMEDWLYTHQTGMTPPAVRQAAHDVGQINDFDAKYASTLSLVKGDIALGRQLGVKSTPTFFINGVKIEGALPPQYFEQAIAYELGHAK
jgi:protein-disulfide isomerase